MNRRNFLKACSLSLVAPLIPRGGDCDKVNGTDTLTAKEMMAFEDWWLRDGKSPNFDPTKQYGYAVYFWNRGGMQSADHRAHMVLMAFVPKEYHAKCSFRHKQPHPDDPDPLEKRGYVAVRYDPKRTTWGKYACTT